MFFSHLGKQVRDVACGSKEKMVHILNISTSAKVVPGPNPMHTSLLQELLDLKRRKGARIFRIYTSHESDPRSYEFTTTNKDVYLKLGDFGSSYSRYVLAKYLEFEFERTADSEVLFRVDELNITWHVIMTYSSRGPFTRFILDPAH